MRSDNRPILAASRIFGLSDVERAYFILLKYGQALRAEMTSNSIMPPDSTRGVGRKQ